MARSLSEIVTASFYAWETRGRGWQLAEYPVSLEPPFRPFFVLPEFIERPESLDDGRRPTIVSRLIDGAKGLFALERPQPDAVEPFEEAPPFPALPRGSLAPLHLRVPTHHDAPSAVAGEFLRALSAGRSLVAFEIVGHDGAVAIQIVPTADDRDHVAQSVLGYFPNASVVPGYDLLARAWDDTNERVVIDFGLANEFFLPLRFAASLPVDPYIPLVGALARTGRGEFLAVQVLFERTRNPWPKAIREALSDGEGGALFDDAPEFIPLAKEKLGSPLFAVSLRVSAGARSGARAWELAQSTRAFILQFGAPGGNVIIPLENKEYPDEWHAKSILCRESFRTGMLLSADELVGLVHLPDRSLRHEALLRETLRTKALPKVAVGNPTVLGVNVHRGEEALATLPMDARMQHTWVIGATGTGKSTLLLNLILQDIEAGQGVAVLDPQGDLVDDIIARIPEGDAERVILFDPADVEQPVGFNILSARSEVERNLLASDMVGIFQRLATSWGDVMTSVLSHAVLAILEHPEGGTLFELRRFLIDERFRKEYLRSIPDAAIRFYWEKEFPLVGTRSIGPILARLDQFLRTRLIRHVVGQRHPKIDLAEAMQSKRVFLAKLSQGLIGMENANLLGSLLVSKFHQLALLRQDVLPEERDYFFLYADEFQHFVTPSMESLLVAARKYRLGLTLAHHTLAQLSGATSVESALFGNAYTRVVFRVGSDDARKLANGCSFFTSEDLERQGLAEAIVRLGTSTQDFNLRTFPAAKVSPEDRQSRLRAIAEHSRHTWGVPAAELEAEIDAALRPIAEEAKQAATPSCGKDTRQPLSNIQTTAQEQARAVSPGQSQEPTLLDEETEPEAASAAVSPPQSKKRTPRVPPLEPAPLGRGGAEHKYLQHLIKRLAEERGFRATIEDTAGDGKADVVLRRGKISIACEVSITTDVEHEIANLKKCQGGGFSRILFVSPERKRREKIAAKIAELGGGTPIDVIGPDELVGALDALQEAPATTETTVRGYKVKVKRQNLSPDDLAGRRAAIAEVIAKSLGK